MSLISWEFLLFCLLLIPIYYVVPRKLQYFIILIFNLFFIVVADGSLFVFMVITVISTYFASALMKRNNQLCMNVLGKLKDADQKERVAVRDGYLIKNRYILFCALILNFGVWGVLKYTFFILVNVNHIRELLGFDILPEVNFALPLGISFYTFQAMGYLIDIYRKKYPIETNFFKLATFITFFPHIIEGPFSRYDVLGKTLFEESIFSYDNLCFGTRRILWGLVKKLLIADKLGVSVNHYFSYIQEYSGIYLIVAAVMYAFQLYADFSGYMDIVCGISLALGIRLEENFVRPFFARSVEDYWRRWHVTLGGWFRDYVFYPISMGKVAQKLGHKARKKYGARIGKLIPSYLALVFVWILTGLWHGAAWKYVMWGMFNLVIIVFSMQAAPMYQKIKKAIHAELYPHLWTAFQITRTFFIVCMLRVMSRCGSFKEGIWVYTHLFGTRNKAAITAVSSFFPDMSKEDVFLALGFSAVLLIVDLLSENNLWERAKAIVPGVLRNAVYVFLIISLLLYAGGDNDLVSGFMYAVF